MGRHTRAAWRGGANLSRVDASNPKRRFPARRVAHEPAPLLAVFVIDDADHEHIRDLRGRRRAQKHYSRTCISKARSMRDRLGRALAQCASVADTVPVRRLFRRKQVEAIPSLLALMLADVAQDAAGRRLEHVMLERVGFHLLRGAARTIGPRGFQDPAARRLRYAAYRYFAHEPRPDDVFIATYPKSGTTLMQMMVYQLSTTGSMDIDHIGDHVPWFEVVGAGRPQYLASLPSPRFFKSHHRRDELPAKGKVIYVVRDVKDVAVSYLPPLRNATGLGHTISTSFFSGSLSGRVPSAAGSTTSNPGGRSATRRAYSSSATKTS